MHVPKLFPLLYRFQIYFCCCSWTFPSHCSRKKTTTMGREGPRAKTKIVLKSVKQWEQLGNMHNWKFQTFLNKNHPTHILATTGIQSCHLKLDKILVSTGWNCLMPQLMCWEAQNDPQTYQGGTLHQYQYIMGRIEAFSALRRDSKGLILPQKFKMWTLLFIHIFPPPTLFSIKWIGHTAI